MKELIAYHYKIYGINVPIVAVSYEKSVIIAFEFTCNKEKLMRYLRAMTKQTALGKIKVVNL